MKLGLRRLEDSQTLSDGAATTKTAKQAVTPTISHGSTRQNFIYIGDHVKLIDTSYSNRFGDVLCGDGIVVNDLFTLISPNLLYESFEFAIVPQRHYTASSIIDADAIEREEVQNASILETNVGSIVRFGDIIQLQHVISKKFVTATLQHEPASDCNEHLKVSLRSGGNQGSWFELLPRYKHDRLSSPIANGSQLSLRSVLTNHFLDISSTNGDISSSCSSRNSNISIDIPRGVSLSMVKHSWKVVISRRPCNTASRVFNGQLVSIVDSENGSRLRVSSSRQNHLSGSGAFARGGAALQSGDRFLCLTMRSSSSSSNAGVEEVEGVGLGRKTRTLKSPSKLTSVLSEISSLWIVERDTSSTTTAAAAGGDENIAASDDASPMSSIMNDETILFSDSVVLRDVTTGLYLAHRIDEESGSPLFFAAKSSSSSMCRLKLAPMMNSTTSSSDFHHHHQRRLYLQPNKPIVIRGISDSAADGGGTATTTAAAALSPAAINNKFSVQSNMSSSSRCLTAGAGAAGATVEDFSESHSESFWFDLHHHRSDADALCGLRAAGYLRVFYGLLFTTDASAVSHELRNFEHVLRSLQRYVRNQPHARLDKVRFNEPAVGDELLASLQTSFREQGVVDALLDILELTAPLSASSPSNSQSTASSSGRSNSGSNSVGVGAGTGGAFCGLDKLKIDSRKLPIEIVRTLTALKEVAADAGRATAGATDGATAAIEEEVGTEDVFSAIAADLAAEGGYNYPGILYLPLRRGMASCRGYLSPMAVVERISRACLRLLLDTIFNHESNKIYVAKRIGVLLSHLRRQPLAATCFVELTRDSACVADWRICNEVISFLLEMLGDDATSHEEALRLLRSICASGGDAFRTNRWLVFAALMKDNKLHDSIYEVKTDDAAASVVIRMDHNDSDLSSAKKGLVRRLTDLFIDTSSDKHGRPLSDANRRVRYFRKSFIVDVMSQEGDTNANYSDGEVLGVNLLIAGIPDISITYNVSPLAGTGAAGGDSSTTSRQKVTVALTSLDSHISYYTAAGKQLMKGAVGAAIPTTSVSISDHLEVQLRLMAALCMGRNLRVITSLRPAYSYDTLIAILTHPNASPGVKAAACCCLRRMYIDVDPQTETVYPRLVRTVHSLAVTIPDRRTFAVAKKVVYECLPSCMDKDHIECGLSSELGDVIQDLLRFGDFVNREQIHCLADGMIEVLDKELCAQTTGERDFDSSVHFNLASREQGSGGVSTTTAAVGGGGPPDTVSQKTDGNAASKHQYHSSGPLRYNYEDDQASSLSSLTLTSLVERLCHRCFRLRRNSPMLYYLKAWFFIGDDIIAAGGSADGLTLEGYVLGFLNSLSVLITILALVVASVVIAVFEINEASHSPSSSSSSSSSPSMVSFNTFVACVFACELGLRAYCSMQVYGQYEGILQSPYYWVDIVVVVLSIIEQVTPDRNGLRNIFRILRVLRIAKFFKAAQTMTRLETARRAKVRSWLPPIKWNSESREKTSLMAKLINCLTIIQSRAEDTDMTILMKAYILWRKESGTVSPLVAYTASINQSRRITFPASLPQTLMHAVMYEDASLSAGSIRLLHSLFSERSKLLADATKAQIISEPRIVSIFDTSSSLVLDVHRKLVLYVEMTNSLPDEAPPSDDSSSSGCNSAGERAEAEAAKAIANDLIAALNELQRLCQQRQQSSTDTDLGSPSVSSKATRVGSNSATIGAAAAGAVAVAGPCREAQDIIRSVGITGILLQFQRLQSFARSRVADITHSFSCSNLALVDIVNARESEIEETDDQLFVAFNSFLTYFALDNSQNQRMLFDYADIWLDDIDVGGNRGSASVLAAIFKDNLDLCRLLSVDRIDMICEGLLVNGQPHRQARLEALVGISSCCSSGSRSSSSASIRSRDNNNSHHSDSTSGSVSVTVSAVALDRILTWIHLTRFRSTVFYWCGPIGSDGYQQRLSAIEGRDISNDERKGGSLLDDDDEGSDGDSSAGGGSIKERLVCHMLSLQLLANVDLGGLQLFAIYPHQHIVAAILDTRTNRNLRDVLVQVLAAGLKSRKAQARWIHASESMLDLLEAIRDALVLSYAVTQRRYLSVDRYGDDDHAGVACVDTECDDGDSSQSKQQQQQQQSRSQPKNPFVTVADGAAALRCCTEDDETFFLIHSSSVVCGFFLDFGSQFTDIQVGLRDDRSVFADADFPITERPVHGIHELVDSLFVVVSQLLYHKSQLLCQKQSKSGDATVSAAAALRHARDTLRVVATPAASAVVQQAIERDVIDKGAFETRTAELARGVDTGLLQLSGKNPFKHAGVARRIRRVSGIDAPGESSSYKEQNSSRKVSSINILSHTRHASHNDKSAASAADVPAWSSEEDQSVTDRYFRTAFLRGLSQLSPCPALTMAKLINGFPREDAAIDAGNIRINGFVRKLCEFVGNSINGDETGFKVVDRSSVDAVLWVLKSLRLAIEIQWDPDADEGMPFDKRMKAGGVIPTDTTVAELQDIYRRSGCCSVCVDLINTGIDDTVVYEATRLLVCMLFKDGGHRVTQEELVRLLSDSETDSSHFFQKLQGMINTVATWCLHVPPPPHGGTSRDANHTKLAAEAAPQSISYTTKDKKENGISSKPPEMAALQLVRLMCEGDYQQSKDLIRVQSRSNAVSVNLVGTLANFVDELSRLGRLTDYDSTLTVFSAIRQLLQGPCVGNQDYLINQTDFVNALNRLVVLYSVRTHIGGVGVVVHKEKEKEKKEKGRRDKGYDAKTVEIVGKINRLLLCCLEGQVTGSVVHSRIANVVNFTIFQSVLLPPSALQETERSGLTEAQRSFLTLVRVFVGHDDYVAARKLGISSRIVDLVKTDVVGIEVLFRGRLKKYFFTFPHFYRAHLKKQFSMLLENIERSSQEHKMLEFMKASTNIYIDLHHQNWLKRLGIYPFISTRNRERMTTIKFISAVVLNVLMLVYYEVNETTLEPDLFDHEFVINGLLVLHLIFCIAVLMITLVGRTPVYYQRALHAEPGKGRISALWKAVLNPKLIYHCIQLILVVVSISVSKMAVSFFMLDIIRVSATARDVLRAISRPARQLCVTGFLAVIALNIFASYAFFRYRDNFHHDYIDGDACFSWWSCLRAFMTYGFRMEAGIGYYMSYDNGLRAFTLDVPMFIIVNVILLDLTFGVIVETFTALRSEKEERQKELTSKCFICGIPATVFDNNMLVGGTGGLQLSKGFDRHFSSEHYAVNYLAFMVKILDQDRHLDDGIERFVRTCLSRNDVSWLPIHRALSVTGPGADTTLADDGDEQYDDEDEGGGGGDGSVAGKKQTASRSTSRTKAALSNTRSASLLFGDAVGGNMSSDHISSSSSIQADLSSASFSMTQSIHRQQQAIIAKLSDLEVILSRGTKKADGGNITGTETGISGMRSPRGASNTPRSARR